MTESELVDLRGLEKRFPLARRLREYLDPSTARAIRAVDGVDLSVRPGETVGLIGESGSGKSTLGWLIARLHEPTAGRILFEGKEVTGLAGPDLRRWRRNVQIVFQDPVGSLDPRLRVWQIIGEPIRAQNPGGLPDLLGSVRRAGVRFVRGESDPAGLGARRRAGELVRSLGRALLRLRESSRRISRSRLRERVADVLRSVGLPPDCLDQYPHEFSGGGRQRISLARAFSVDPKLIVLDEPTSALDVAVQSQILNRLVELQKERGVSYLLITHNVAAVRYVADRVAVLYLGRIVELGDVRRVLSEPVHPYTKALIAALPVPDVRSRRTRYRVTGDVPTLIDPPPGCRFAPRCPFVIARCWAEYPALRTVPGKPGHLVSCHRAEEVGSVLPAELLGLPAGAPPVSSPTAS